MKYRTEIDGLRALAVVPVILFHAGFKLFSGGFVGVDVFFVISGYLITTMLIEDIENNRFSLLNFYERRARRILPALFLVILVSIPFAWILMQPSQLLEFSQSLIAISTFTSNILLWFEGGYFENAAAEKPFLHTWSLAVEEQYYILFPIFLVLTWQYGKNCVFWMIVVMATVSLLLCEWGSRNYLAANFYLTPTRAWELLAGSITGFLVQKNIVKANNFLAMLGLILISIAIFYYDEKIPFPSFYTLIPILGVVLIIIYGQEKTLVAKILSAKLFVFIGSISYSAYLWHQPLFAFTRIGLEEKPSLIIIITLILACFILATLSWKFIEQPFRKKVPLIKDRNKYFGFSIIVIVFFIIVGFIGYERDGHKFGIKKKYKGDVSHLEFHRYIDRKYFDCEPRNIAKKAGNWKKFLRCKQTKKGESDWVLLGDSHAEHLFLGLAESRPKKNIVFYTLGGKPYVDNPIFKDIFKELSEAKQSKKVLLTMYYLGHVTDFNNFYTNFSKTVRKLKEYGHEVIILGNIPAYKVDPEDWIFSSSKEEFVDYSNIKKPLFDSQNAILTPLLKKIAIENKVVLIDLYKPLCNKKNCSMVKGNTILYRDRSHLNIPGSLLIGSYLSLKLNE